METYLHQHNLTLVDSKDPIRGRYIKSTATIPKGTVIITSQPLGTVALPQTINEYCNYCFRKQTRPPLQRCSRCKSVYFCDMGCFSNAWLSYHQFVCDPSRVSRHQDAENELDLEMLEKVALNVARYRKRVKTEKEAEGETVEVTMEAFFSLMGHDASQAGRVLSSHQRLAREALKKAHVQQTSIDEKELVHYLNVFKSNNFTLDDQEMFAIGEGTYPVASLFNHTCRPNAVILFDGALAEIRAIETIAPDTEITISYIDPAHSRTHRKRVLREKYFFDCQCVRCTRQEGPKAYLSLVDAMLGEEEDDWDRAQQLLGNDDSVRSRLLKDIEAWDLLALCKIYDRKSDGCLDPSRPLDISHYTHYLIQFFAPYLLTSNQPELHQQQVGQARKTSLTDFDDPLPSHARPAVQSSYDDILRTALTDIMTYPVSDIVPYRLSTLSIATRLFYDEMAEGHWQNAVRLGMYILIQYCFIYPPYHPMLAQHFLNLAKASWNAIIQLELISNERQLEKVYERGVRRWIMSSKETVAISFGKNSPLWRETLELEWIFLREQNLK
ncbi:hypothetical protein G6F57_009704 [Rhizopus arrhizus]|nr:hypothetical protein G6F23_006368 [Rhizopus arrhizus]KAG1419625.1 hypothetical protein G6F58_004516 [Rhizopus delemar]KAG0758645.1 hypothetical protein G6F24_009648 [Rhizopus arrhizus]KAG0907286.1 hypothetical protein G6F33_010706 [Rhizopus arrhizus]KAG0935296.1 hypothetical protein G6F30_009396 [Rhizopus arrhizus]